MRCSHRLWLSACGPCRRSAANLHIHVCGERERHTLKLLAEQAEAMRAREDEGDALEPGEVA